jgi:hypothetical protein
MVWASGGLKVDNHQLSTIDQTTHVQDVSGAQMIPDGVVLATKGRPHRHPQSTALITVIRNSYLLPQITGETR